MGGESRMAFIGFALMCFGIVAGCTKKSSAPPFEASATPLPCPKSGLLVKETARTLSEESAAFVKTQLLAARGEDSVTAVRHLEADLASVSQDEQKLVISLLRKTGSNRSVMRTAHRLIIRLNHESDGPRRTLLVASLMALNAKKTINGADFAAVF